MLYDAILYYTTRPSVYTDTLFLDANIEVGK